MKTRKNGLVPMSRQKNVDLFLLFLARLQTWPETLHRYSFIESSRNEAFRHFLSNGLPWKQWLFRKFDFSFRYIFSSSVTVESFITIKRQRKKVINDQNFQIFCFLTTLKTISFSMKSYSRKAGIKLCNIVCEKLLFSYPWPLCSCFTRLKFKVRLT